MHDVVRDVTDRIIARSADRRGAYLERLERSHRDGPQRERLSCGNLAHGCAASDQTGKNRLAKEPAANIGIVSAYNEMLSAHQPYLAFPPLIRAAVREVGAEMQFAGGVPAMCDGVTQGQVGMELSLFSRDVIAQATAVALSHNMFDGALCLGICDKIVPGLLIGALTFGHLPTLFVPAGPMPSGLSNKEKARAREQHATGEIGRDGLLAAEMASYHSPGTCTFYGTANSNQMLMELMGLQLPGSSFVNPGTPLRDALTRAAARQVISLTAHSGDYRPIGRIVDERAVVNGVAGLLATGGSTNHTMHLVAIARAAGIVLTWEDIDALSAVVPLLARVYPNGSADVNQFHAAGGLAWLTAELRRGGFVHDDVMTVAGPGLAPYTCEAVLEDGLLTWRQGPATSRDPSILRTFEDPFAPDGGIKLMQGNLGRAVTKTSAVAPEHRLVEAPAVIFDDQDAMVAAFKRGELHRDHVAVVRFQGPRVNGMPELHKLTPPLGVLQDLGYRVALITDGRMSGASGKVPSAIHVTPEAGAGGGLARLRDGDIVRYDADNGRLEALVPAEEWQARPLVGHDPSRSASGYGRELFAGMRSIVSPADEGAASFGWAA
ncbi:phosphogluconate dehydratase [Oceanibacterium hippocampi]|uniref:Phosphogluconate dehydratase n=1 Tax=Oceanibacterium hippocampi TaxID=745714 RepID=A0A1Y5TW35_9PROT|nr:phosphogluconate dehydratase [Oceanibacterium hippocampi]SLN74802.1 Phosphogluconate dehydratase [Oceanibacterium hippocampi]